jgi:simple sugar transport system permease protein
VVDRIRQGSVETLLSAAVAALAIVFAMLLVALAGAPPDQAASKFFEGAFGSTTALTSTAAKMIPLTLVALAWIVVFRGGRYHVGFQGQMLIGGALTAVVALKISGLPMAIHLPLAIVAGMVGGALYAGVVAWLWAKRGVNEILSTLLLNLVAIQVISWLVRGPLQEPGKTLPQSDFLPDTAVWPLFFEQPFLRWDIIWIPIAVAAVAYLMTRTKLGFNIRLVGANPSTALHAGISPRRIGAYAIVLSGVLAGLAGSSMILASETRVMTDRFDGGYGFQGIAVALLARNNPVAVIPAALLFAALQQGGGVLQAELEVSSAVVGITQGVVILLVIAASALVMEPRAARRPAQAAEAS